MSLLVLLHCDR